MAKTLTVEIPDNVYDLLLVTATQTGQTPEQIIVGWVERRIEQAINDPLLQLAGIFESDIIDISERHDEYIGETLRGV